MAALVLQCRDHAGEGGCRIGYGTAVGARMQVLSRAPESNLDIDETPEADHDAGQIGIQHGSVRDDARIARQSVLIVLHESLEIFATHFLFAFKHELQIDRRWPDRLLVGIERLEMEVDLPFIVGRSASVDTAVSGRWLERRGNPFVQGLYRLYIVVPVDENRRCVITRLEQIAIDDRMARRLEDLGPHTEFFHLGAQPLGAMLHVAIVL